MGERWKSIPGYEGIYEVSDLGRVRRLTFDNHHVRNRPIEPRILRSWLTKHGYARVALSKNGKSTSPHVHRLVLIAFVGPPPEGYEAAHLNGDRADSRLCNLAWKTRKDNHADKILHGTAQRGERNPNAKLTETDVVAIRKMKAGGLRAVDASRRLGIPLTSVYHVWEGRRWTHI